MTKETTKSNQDNDILIPETLPLFSVSGAVIFPHARLPLNIYETPYVAMIDESLGHGRFIGVIQPASTDETPNAPSPLYKVGTVCKIVSFAESDDGRYLITIQGICRFRLAEELESQNGYRRGRINTQDFLDDLHEHDEHDLDRVRLTQALGNYFKTHGISADWNIVQNAAGEELVSSLAMICPLEPNEKQALLESATFRTRVDLLVTLLEMATMSGDDGESACH